MQTKIMRACALGTLLALASPSWAAWPHDEPIKIVVPFPAGGGADTIVRLFSEELSKELGQKVIIDNRAGAGGTIGTTYAARSKADGYTVLYATNGTFGINLAMYQDLQYNPMKDFTPVSRLTQISLVLATSDKDVKDFPDWMKQAKNKTTDFGSAGFGTTSQLVGTHLSQTFGLNALHVPYRGGAAAMLDLLSNRVNWMIDVSPNVINHAKDGKLTALAVTGQNRLPGLPNVPTFSELGVKNVELFAWDALAVPAGTDPKIVEKLHNAVVKTLNQKAVREKLEARGSSIQVNDPQDIKVFFSEEAEKWTRLVKQTKANEQH